MIFSKKENSEFYYRINTDFYKREVVYTRFEVYDYEGGGVYVNTPGVGARVEYPRHDVRNDVVVPHFFHLRTCD